jgi:hypothetical protein
MAALYCRNMYQDNTKTRSRKTFLYLSALIENSGIYTHNVMGNAKK